MLGSFRWLSLLFLTIGGLCLLACSSSRDDGTESIVDQTDITVSPPDILLDISNDDVMVEPIPSGPLHAVFSASEIPETGLYLEVENLEEESIRIRVRTAGLIDIFGIAFRLVYDADLMEVVSIQAANTLEGDGATSHTVFHENKDNQLVYGAARFHQPGQWGQVQYTGVSLDGAILATIELKLKKEGTGEIQFHPLGRDIRDISLENIEVSWVGTTVDIGHEQEGGAP